MNIPPLLGDDKGQYRVVFVGNSGKALNLSTTGKMVASILGVPFISMDHIHWLPDWQERTPAEFQAVLRQKIAEAPNGWVVDGNYNSRGGLIAFDQATDVIWLDPPFMCYFPRLIKRTIARLFGYGIPCAPGCNETWKSVFFSKDSIIWWCFTHHSSARARGMNNMAKIGINVGTDINRRRMRRIGGWGTICSSGLLMCERWPSPKGIRS
ncbi:hypothetical protein BJ165DRAFT_1356704 [Panaeolus papilionaceus]|nr:hypothetical protein BJ165DRAFT_1356704 [Panaeolus papilionaceus]